MISGYDRYKGRIVISRFVIGRFYCSGARQTTIPCVFLTLPTDWINETIKTNQTLLVLFTVTDSLTPCVRPVRL